LRKLLGAGDHLGKKNYTCTPFPDRERSTASGTPTDRQLSAKATTSPGQDPLSKRKPNGPGHGATASGGQRIQLQHQLRRVELRRLRAPAKSVFACEAQHALVVLQYLRDQD
jgi:hypothetical protein